MAEENEISTLAEPTTQITYHGAGGRTHVTAMFALDQLEYVVERIRAQRQCWADEAVRAMEVTARVVPAIHQIGGAGLGKVVGRIDPYATAPRIARSFEDADRRGSNDQ